MSTNCTRCVKNPRTGADLLCDECRGEASHDLTQTERIDSLELAKQAINHVLNRIQEDPNARYHLGYGTQSFTLLSAAHSALNGISEEAIAEEVFIELPRKSAAEILDEIRDLCDSSETRPSTYGEVITKIGELCRS